jgi:hypothetical protein
MRESWKGWEHSHRDLGGADLRDSCAVSREVLVLQRVIGPTSWIIAACGNDVNARHAKTSIKKAAYSNPEKRGVCLLCYVALVIMVA